MVTALSEHLICSFERLLHHLQGTFPALGNACEHSLKSQYQPLHTLQKCVVQIASNSFALDHALFEAHTDAYLNLLHAHQVQQPQSADDRGDTKRGEPKRLIEGWYDRKVQTCAGFVPHPVVVAGDDLEPIVARRQIGVERLPSRA